MGLSRSQVVRDALIGGPRAIASLAGLVRYARLHRIAIVHGTEKPRDAFYGYLLARAAGAKCVVHLHVKAEAWISKLTRWAMGRADALVAISHFVARSIVALGYDPSRVHVVHNALDPEPWDPADADEEAVRRELGIEPDTVVLAIVSRIFFWKGHLDLVRALLLVVRRRPDVRLLVVGEDADHASPDRPSTMTEMRRFITAHGLEESVEFTGFHADIRDIMAACDIFAMPSFEEPFGMVFLEAMCLRRPVVALDNGGTPEVVADGVTGLLSAPGDIDQLAENLLALIEDPSRRRQMGDAGRQRALEVFSPVRMAAATQHVYDALLADRRAITR